MASSSKEELKDILENYSLYTPELFERLSVVGIPDMFMQGYHMLVTYNLVCQEHLLELIRNPLEVVITWRQLRQRGTFEHPDLFRVQGQPALNKFASCHHSLKAANLLNEENWQLLIPHLSSKAPLDDIFDQIQPIGLLTQEIFSLLLSNIHHHKDILSALQSMVEANLLGTDYLRWLEAANGRASSIADAIIHLNNRLILSELSSTQQLWIRQHQQPFFAAHALTYLYPSIMDSIEKAWSMIQDHGDLRSIVVALRRWVSDNLRFFVEDVSFLLSSAHPIIVSTTYSLLNDAGIAVTDANRTILQTYEDITDLHSVINAFSRKELLTSDNWESIKEYGWGGKHKAGVINLANHHQQLTQENWDVLKDHPEPLEALKALIALSKADLLTSSIRKLVQRHLHPHKIPSLLIALRAHNLLTKENWSCLITYLKSNNNLEWLCTACMELERSKQLVEYWDIIRQNAHSENMACALANLAQKRLLTPTVKDKLSDPEEQANFANIIVVLGTKNILTSTKITWLLDLKNKWLLSERARTSLWEKLPLDLYKEPEFEKLIAHLQAAESEEAIIAYIETVSSSIRELSHKRKVIFRNPLCTVIAGPQDITKTTSEDIATTSFQPNEDVSMTTPPSQIRSLLCRTQFFEREPAEILIPGLPPDEEGDGSLPDLPSTSYSSPPRPSSSSN
jgi:hypothetical protein